MKARIGNDYLCFVAPCPVILIVFFILLQSKSNLPMTLSDVRREVILPLSLFFSLPPICSHYLFDFLVGITVTKEKSH